MKNPTLFFCVTWLVRRTLLTSLLVALRTLMLSSRTHRHSLGLPAFLFAYWFCVSTCDPIVAGVGEEPDPVPLDRTADGDVVVPVLPQRRRVAEAERAQRIVDVGRLSPLPGEAAEVVAAEGVAARLRDDVEHRRAAIRFAKAAGDRHLDLGRVVHVVHVARDAAAVARRPDVQAVDLDRALVAAAAARGEEVVAGRTPVLKPVAWIAGTAAR